MKTRAANGYFEMDWGTYIDSKGYPTICAGPLRGTRVHRLIALAKFGEHAMSQKDAVVHHKDGNKLNCHPDNLELMTEREHNAVSAKQYHYLKTNVWPKEKTEWDAYFAEANGD
jgi:hypothetical protein